MGTILGKPPEQATASVVHGAGRSSESDRLVSGGGRPAFSASSLSSFSTSLQACFIASTESDHASEKGVSPLKSPLKYSSGATDKLAKYLKLRLVQDVQ